MSHRSLRNQMEGSNYKDKCGQWVDDVGRMSNHKKRNDTSERGKRIGVNCNITPLLSPRL